MIFLAMAPPMFGQGPPTEFEKLETTNGKIYEHAKVRRVEPDGISIMHDAGTAKVLFENLSPDLQSAFGYSPEKAAAHRENAARQAALSNA
ncbi:hypothetical protein HQ447_00230, partial [bacterium]|nr:hypothetical protein [bacterium]